MLPGTYLGMSRYLITVARVLEEESTLRNFKTYLSLPIGRERAITPV